MSVSLVVVFDGGAVGVSLDGEVPTEALMTLAAALRLAAIRHRPGESLAGRVEEEYAERVRERAFLHADALLRRIEREYALPFVCEEWCGERFRTERGLAAHVARSRSHRRRRVGGG